MRNLILLFSLVFLCTITWAQNTTIYNCLKSTKEFSRLNDSAAVNVYRKLFITANSYFNAANNLKEQNDSCKLIDEKMSKLHLSIIPGSTYQTLLERVIALQDENRFEDAYTSFNLASKYYTEFKVADLGIVNDSIVPFTFAHCQGGFASWLYDTLQNQKRYEECIDIYEGMLNRGYEPTKLKRPLYDLSVLIAIRDKALYPNENPKTYHKKYMKDYPIFKYFKLGYLYGWDNN